MTRTTANSVRYRFDDFTHEQYAQLLQFAQVRYVFRGFSDFKREEMFVLWRHDLDFSVSDALPLAEIEARAGVRATYFVHLNSNFYNPFSNDNRAHLKEIARLGHEIGLHFDFEYHCVGGEEMLEACVLADARRLQEELALPVRAFSFHNPTPAALAFDRESYAGLVNTYARYFRQTVGYCSDSNGHWAYDRLHDVLQEAPVRPLQVLTHPTWWTAEAMAPRQKVRATLEAHASTVFGQYRAMLAAAGRPDIDW